MTREHAEAQAKERRIADPEHHYIAEMIESGKWTVNKYRRRH